MNWSLLYAIVATIGLVLTEIQLWRYSRAAWYEPETPFETMQTMLRAHNVARELMIRRGVHGLDGKTAPPREVRKVMAQVMNSYFRMQHIKLYVTPAQVELLYAHMATQSLGEKFATLLGVTPVDSRQGPSEEGDEDDEAM